MKMWQIHTGAEAPRQRRKEREPEPAPVRLSNWIWLRTESIDGIPVRTYHTHVWFMCGTDGAKGFPDGQKVSVFDRRPEPTANCSGLHPGNRYSLSLKREQRGTQETCIASPFGLHTVPVGQCRSRRRHSSPRAGKPFTWRRTPAGSERRHCEGGIRWKSSGSANWQDTRITNSTPLLEGSIIPLSNGKGTGGEPDDGKLSRPVRRAAGGKDSFI